MGLNPDHLQVGTDELVLECGGGARWGLDIIEAGKRGHAQSKGNSRNHSSVRLCGPLW